MFGNKRKDEEKDIFLEAGPWSNFAHKILEQTIIIASTEVSKFSSSEELVLVALKKHFLEMAKTIWEDAKDYFEDDDKPDHPYSSMPFRSFTSSSTIKLPRDEIENIVIDVCKNKFGLKVIGAGDSDKPGFGASGNSNNQPHGGASGSFN